MKFKKIAIVALSNPLTNTLNLKNLDLILQSLELNVVYSKHLILKDSILNRDYLSISKEFTSFFKDPSIDGIFDISGGDLCNSILDYLDFEEISNNPKPFFGYSDLTVVLNALYEKSKIPTFNYQIMNLVRDTTKMQIKEFKDTFIEDKNLNLFNWNFEFLQGDSLNGIVIGGNIRCFLKLAGTSYLPSFKNKILLLESNSGDAYKMITFLNQYKSMCFFENISGIILGNFTEMENKNINPTIIDILNNIICKKNIPIVKTFEIGHGSNSKCISIGSSISLNKK